MILVVNSLNLPKYSGLEMVCYFRCINEVCYRCFNVCFDSNAICLFYFFLLLLMKSFEEGDLMIMRAIDQQLRTKSDWMRDIIKRFL